MANFTSPVGGNIRRGATVVPVAQWQGNWDGVRAQVTQTDDGGGTGVRVFVQNPSMTATLYLDDAGGIEAAGFTLGAYLASVKCLLGTSGECDHLENTTVVNISRTLSADGQAIGTTFTCEGGKVTTNTSV